MLEIQKLSLKNLTDMNDMFSLYQEFYEIDEKNIDKESNINFFKEILKNYNSGQMFVSYIDWEPVGMITLYYTYSSLSKQKVWILNDLYLLDKYRGKWYWKEMIKYSMNFFKEQWIKKMTLETHTDNIWAQKLYDSLGWEWEIWKLYEFIL